MDQIKKIQLFIEGKLNAKEAEAFESEMKKDATLQKEVDDYRTIFSGLKGLQQEAFRNQLRTQSKKSAKKIPLWSTFNLRKFAAVALLLIVSSIAYFYVHNQWNNETLLAYAEENYVEPKIDSFRGAVNSGEWLKKAKQYFTDNIFQKCIDEIDKINKEDSLYLEAQFIKGHSLYQMGEYERAEKVFLNIETIKDVEKYSTITFDLDNAAWTLILSQLQMYNQNKMEKTILLRSIKLFLQRKSDEVDYEIYKKKAEDLKELLE